MRCLEAYTLPLTTTSRLRRFQRLKPSAHRYSILPTGSTVDSPLLLFTASLFGIAVCLLPVAFGSVSMDVNRASQAGLVRYLKRSLRISNPRVERSLLAVDRRYFVDPSVPLYMVYQDIPLPIGFGETISAPHMHASCLGLLEDRMTEHARILDVGSGSGYLTASLAIMGGPDSIVLGVEKHRELAERSMRNIRSSNPELLTELPNRLRIVAGNALSKTLANEDLFDVIHVGAAASSVPQLLVDKLAPGGRMVIPVGPRSSYQELLRIDKDIDGRVTIEPLMQKNRIPFPSINQLTMTIQTTHHFDEPCVGPLEIFVGCLGIFDYFEKTNSPGRCCTFFVVN